MKKIIILVTFCSFVLAFIFIVGCGVTTSGNGTVYHSLTVSCTDLGSVEATPPGTFCPASTITTLEYISGTLVTLEALPDFGCGLDNWALDLTGKTNPATIEMTANHSVEAHFSP